MFKYFLLIIMIAFSGCSIKYTNGDFKGKSERYYSEVSKDAIFEATKKIFLFEAQRDFRIDSYREHLVISRTKLSFPPLDPSSYDDIFKLTITEEDNISKAKLELKRVVDFDDKNPIVLPESIHNIIWDRIDYMLGLRNKWPSCENLYIPLRYRSDALCDYKDFIPSTIPTKQDQLNNVLIKDRKISKNLFMLEDDILKDDITLTIDENKSDILDKEDKIDDIQSSDEIDSNLDAEIEKLDKEVSKNIEKTLSDIDEPLEDDFKQE